MIEDYVGMSYVPLACTITAKITEKVGPALYYNNRRAGAIQLS